MQERVREVNRVQGVLERANMKDTDVDIVTVDNNEGRSALLTGSIDAWATWDPFYASVEDVMRRQSGCFDAVYLHRASVAQRYAALARVHQPRARLVYAVADLVIPVPDSTVPNNVLQAAIQMSQNNSNLCVRG